MNIPGIAYHRPVSGLLIHHHFSVDFNPKSIRLSLIQQVYLDMNIFFFTPDQFFYKFLIFDRKLGNKYLLPEFCDRPYAIMFFAIYNLQRLFFLSIREEHIIRTFQSYSITLLFLPQLLFRRYFTLGQVLYHLVQLINFQNVRRLEALQAFQPAPDTVHQTIDRCRNITYHGKHYSHTYKGTHYNGSKNTAVQLISQTINRFFCNKTAKYPVRIFIRHLTAVQIQFRHYTINILSANRCILYEK